MVSGINAVSSGFCADVQYWITDTGSLAEKDLILTDQTKRERINQRVQRIRVVKSHFTAYGRDAKRVAIVSNPAHDACEQ